MNFRPTWAEFFRFHLLDKPFRGAKQSPWEQRRQYWLRNQIAARSAQLAYADFRGEELADDCKLDSDNLYKHFYTAKRDAHDLQRMLAEVDTTFFEGCFARNGVLPDIAWWWRGAKVGANSATGGLACLHEGQILIHFRFNTAEIAGSAVKLLVYHELLHFALFYAEVAHGHTNAFKHLERKFEGFTAADKEMSDFYRSSIIGKCIGKKKPPRVLHELGRSEASTFRSKEMFKILHEHLHTPLVGPAKGDSQREDRGPDRWNR